MTKQLKLLIDTMDGDCKDYENIEHSAYNEGWYQATKFWLEILKKIVKEKDEND